MIELGSSVVILDVKGLSADQLNLSNDDFQDFLCKVGKESAVVFDCDDIDDSVVDIVFKNGLEVFGVSKSRLMLLDDSDESPESLDFILENLNLNPFAHKQRIVAEKFSIVEDGTGLVTINGFTLYGFVDGGECSQCGGTIRIYDTQFDQYFCPSCNVWEEPFCKNKECKYCNQNHPEHPLPVFGENDDTFPKRSSEGWKKLKFITGIDA